tara:strand:+ start:813 stop:1253 length:441 start_codon:yes stop_codon:yes gene_type:complete
MASTSSAPVGGSEIEVERKFKLTSSADFELRLTQAGASFRGEKQFVDCYFDTADFALARFDHWLRTRDGSIELKMPAEEHGAQGATTVYRELTDRPAIATRLTEVGVHIAEGVAVEAALEVFAEFRTIRRKFTWCVCFSFCVFSFD